MKSSYLSGCSESQVTRTYGVNRTDLFIWAERYRLYGNRYREQENALREEQEKSRLKRQLTNNINHELKTPVASIQVCLERLLSGISLTEEKKQELIERCYTNNERLRNLLQDVSLITRMEDGSSSIEREPVVINNLLHEIEAELSIIPEGERFELCIDFNTQLLNSYSCHS